MKGRLMRKEFIHRVKLSLNKEIWKPLVYMGVQHGMKLAIWDV